jgi:Icc-related predicted phosphoesterase
MKLTFFSDTHRNHDKLQFNGGDVLVFCGDLTSRGSLADVESFANFTSKLDYQHKVVIAGNHDFCFENQERALAERIFKDHGLIYLNDSGVEINGVKFWGSPIQPWFHNWAFNRARGEAIKKHWDLIPNDIDILITHGPPAGVLDLCHHGERVGCADLLMSVAAIKPRVHAFGHIHECYGTVEIGKTLFVNACNLNEKYLVTNPPIDIDFDK